MATRTETTLETTAHHPPADLVVVQVDGVAQPVGRRVDVASVGRGLLVLRPVHREEVLQFPLERLEGRPFHGVAVPALHHDVVEGGGTARRTRHAVAVVDLVEDLRIRHA